MTAFADSYYYIALLSESDSAHEKAVQFSRSFTDRTLTTVWVLTEVADALAAPSVRSLFPALYERLRGNPEVTIVPPTSELFEQGIDLYARRPDKSWSLTDCISFVVMQRYRLVQCANGRSPF